MRCETNRPAEAIGREPFPLRSQDGSVAGLRLARKLSSRYLPVILALAIVATCPGS
jgi:hypothetical protein